MLRDNEKTKIFKDDHKLKFELNNKYWGGHRQLEVLLGYGGLTGIRGRL